MSIQLLGCVHTGYVACVNLRQPVPFARVNLSEARESGK